jgi:uncharacterized protein
MPKQDAAQPAGPDVTPTSGLRARPADQVAVGGWRLLVALGVWIGLAAAAGAATWTVLPALAPAWGATDRLASVISAEAYLALVVALLFAFGGITRVRDRLRLGPAPAAAIGLGLLVWVGCLVAILLVYLVLVPILGPVSALGEELVRVGTDWGRLPSAGPLLAVLIVVRACLLAPLGEELLFRGALFGWLRARLGAAAAITATSVVFALVHQSPVLLPAAFVFGLGMAWVRERTGSTTPTVVAHVVNNVVLVTVAWAAA